MPEQTLQSKAAHVYADPTDVPALTDEEVAQARKAMREAAALRSQMLARHGGELLAESWPVIRAARLAHSRQL